MPYINGEYKSPTWVNGSAPAISESELQAMNTAMNSARKSIGEMLLTLRTLNDSDYLLCDGSDFDRDTYPDLAKLIPKQDIEIYPFAENADDMVFASSMDGKYYVRATSDGTASEIEYFDRTEELWESFSYIGTRPTSLWKDIVVNDSGKGFAINSNGYYIVLDCVNHTAQGYNQIANYTFEKISINNDGDAVAITDEASGNRLFFRSHINNTWVERTALSNVPLMVAGEPIMCKIVNNGFVYVAINCVIGGYNHTKFFKSYDFGLSWISIYQNGLQYCNAVDVGDDGVAVAMFLSNQLIADDVTNTWQPFGGAPYLLRSVGGVSVNNNGKFFFSGIRDNQASTVISFLCDIASDTSITFSDAEIPFISNPKLNNAYSVLGSIAGGRTRFITSDNKVFTTSDNKTFVVSSGGGIGGMYMCDYLSSIGELPDSSNIQYGSFNASDIGKLYICGDINANIDFVNWQNNVTPISADNMLSLSESVEKLQLYVGDFVISAIDNLETTESHLLKCVGQTVSNTDYPLLYPLLTSYYGTNKLPDFENDGIQGLHLYIKAS